MPTALCSRVIKIMIINLRETSYVFANTVGHNATFVQRYWSLVRRVTSPTVVAADVGIPYRKGRTGIPCINSVPVRDFGVSLNLRRGVKPEKNEYNLKKMG